MSYQSDFIEFLVDSGALTFGDFITKSGRKTPYFVNTGRFNTGALISELGDFYAKHLVASDLIGCSAVVGPAYKGIPLAVSTASALARNHDLNIGYSFNRKEKKAHGDGGEIVGAPINESSKLIIVEDVITAGTTLQEIVPWLRERFSPQILGVIIAVDRCERGSGDRSAVQQVEAELGIKVFPIITARDIIEALKDVEFTNKHKISKQAHEQITQYLNTYGV